MYRAYTDLYRMAPIIDEQQQEKKKERSKPSVERRGYSSEVKYNQFVKDLYKSKMYNLKKNK
jgi:hypothetical protein